MTEADFRPCVGSCKRPHLNIRQHAAWILITKSNVLLHFYLDTRSCFLKPSVCDLPRGAFTQMGFSVAWPHHPFSEMHFFSRMSIGTEVISVFCWTERH